MKAIAFNDDVNNLTERGAYTLFAGKPAPTGFGCVGAGLLAIAFNDDVNNLTERGAWAFFAGKPAPIEDDSMRKLL